MPGCSGRSVRAIGGEVSGIRESWGQTILRYRTVSGAAHAGRSSGSKPHWGLEL